MKWAATLLALTALPFAAAAQDAASPRRYSIAPSDGGFVRLDTETGNVSHCVKRDGTWLCEPAEEQAGAETDELAEAIGQLTLRVDRLAGEVADLSARLDQLAAPQVVGSEAPPAGPVPEEPATAEKTGDNSLVSRLLGPLFALVGGKDRAREAD